MLIKEQNKGSVCTIIGYGIMKTNKQTNKIVVWQNYSQETYIINNDVKTMQHKNIRFDHL